MTLATKGITGGDFVGLDWQIVADLRTERKRRGNQAGGHSQDGLRQALPAIPPRRCPSARRTNASGCAMRSV